MTRRKLDTATATATGTATALTQQSSVSSSSPSSKDVNPSILITVLIIAIAVILSASLYLLLRFLRRNRRTTTETTAVFRHSLSTTSEQSLRRVSPIINALPLFTYNNNQRAGDCAVCLSKFENDDVLRLLPVCCHAFHAECIDTWLSANLTCPLCRSPIILSEIDVIGKLTGQRSGSFRVEIGNVSSRRGETATSAGEIRRSYSIGNSFDYVVAGEDDVVAEVGIPIPVGEYYKEADVTAEQQEAFAAEVGSRDGGWLKDFLSYSLYPRTASFRGSGRIFFTGSSRRSTVEVNTGNGGYEDDANRLGEEIHDLFSWLSGN